MVQPGYEGRQVVREESVVDAPVLEGRTRTMAAFAVAVVGALVAAFSLLSATWVTFGPQSATFGDLHDTTKGAAVGRGADLFDHLQFRYYQFGGYALLALVVVLLAAVGATLMSRDNSGVRGLAAFVAALAAIVHGIVVAQADGDLEIGAWLGTVGYVVVVVGLSFCGTRVLWERRQRVVA